MPATAYATSDNLIDAIGETRLRGVLEIGAAVDIAIQPAVVDALEDANSTVDAHVRAQYNVPPASPPAFLRRAAVSLAWWHLVSVRDDLVTDTDRDRRDDAMSVLKRVSSGAAAIDAGDAPDMMPLETISRVDVGSASDTPDNASACRSVYNQRWYTEGQY